MRKSIFVITATALCAACSPDIDMPGDAAAKTKLELTELVKDVAATRIGITISACKGDICAIGVATDETVPDPRDCGYSRNNSSGNASGYGYRRVINLVAEDRETAMERMKTDVALANLASNDTNVIHLSRCLPDWSPN